MVEIKKTFSLLLLYLLVVFSLENVYFSAPLIVFPSHFYFFISFAVLMTVLVPNLRWLSLYNLLIFWAVIFWVVAGFYFSYNGYGNLQVIVLEFMLIEVSILIAYQLNRQLRSAETVMDGLAFSTYPNRTYDLQAASDRVDMEFTRSRRHHRPLTVISVDPEKISRDESQEAYKELRKDLLKHFVEARIGQIIAEQARQTDLILRDRHGKFIVLCAETDQENSSVLAERIEMSVKQHIGASLYWGVASFPKDALTFDELVRKAREKLSVIV